MKNIFSTFAVILTLLTSLTLGSCSKSEEYSLNVPAKGIIVTKPGDSGTTSFDSSNITSITATSVPSGWTVNNIDMYNSTITVTAPSSFDNDEEQNGTITLKGYTPTGNTKSIDIYVAIVENIVDYYASPANCYVATKPDTRYIFNPMIGGCATPLQTAKVQIIWETTEKLIQYLDMRDGKASFYIAGYKEDEDAEDVGVKAGNALVGGYDESGNLIWSWHIWVTNNDPVATENTITLNGETLMNFNLGAECNSNGSTDGTTIFNSYGLYYQWGRRTPFVGPAMWNFWDNKDMAIYNSSGYLIYLDYVASDDTTGDVAWALNNPMSIITGNNNNGYDWLFSGHDQLWSETSKSEHDPCPKGWRIPDSSIFENLTISPVDDAIVDWQEAQKMYGWHLEDENGSYFFSAAGRRNYLDGRLDNMNDDSTKPIPWSGYYWTSSAAENGDAKAMWFDLNSESRALWNGFDAARSMHRANAMPVRCVKE